MALIEGHAEHVMDAAGAPVAADARRSCAPRSTAAASDRPPLFKLLERLLGLEMKLRQYEHGKRFCDAVVARGGIDGAQPRVARRPSCCRRSRSSTTRRRGSAGPSCAW